MLSFRARLAVAAYVLFTWPVMTAFLFGPLAALVAASRPQGRRAWLWLAALAAWLALWAAQPGGLLEQVVRAAAALSTGVGVLILVYTSGSVSARALCGPPPLVVSGTVLLARLCRRSRWRRRRAGRGAAGDDRAAGGHWTC